MVKLFLFSLILISLPFIIRPGYAQTCPTPSPAASARVEGLISAVTFNGLNNAQGNCILGSPAPVQVGSAKILRAQSFADLKRTFFNSSRFTLATTNKKTFNADNFSAINFTADGLNYFQKLSPTYTSGDLTITAANGSPSGNGTEVIFVDGNLNIKSNLNYPTTKGGLVFIVAGDINIYLDSADQAGIVTRVDAVLISFGTICTAVSFPGGVPQCSSTNVNVAPAKALTINGALISLACSDTTNTTSCDQTKNYIQLRRSLTTNSTPAEIINSQPKYLVNLAINDLMDEDLIIPNEN